jgi:hypothetical protein
MLLFKVESIGVVKIFVFLHMYLLEVLVLVVSDASIKDDESYMKR